MPIIVFLLSIFLIFPSKNVAFGTGGTLGLLAYLILPPLSFSILLAVERSKPWAQWLKRHEKWLLALASAFLVMMLVVRYPMSQAGLLGVGSDRDEALDIGISRLLAGEFPYYARTYLGGRLTPMPGAFLLAAPFHLLGGAAWQNLLWGPIGLVLLTKMTSGLQARAAFAIVVFFGQPLLLQDYMHGGDLGVNCFYVAAALMLVHHVSVEGNPRRRNLIVSAIFLGIAIVSRPIFASAAILGVSYIFGHCGRRHAAIFTAALVSIMAILILPFLLYDASAFMPQHLISQLPKAWFGTSIALSVAGLLVATAPAYCKIRQLSGLYGCMAISLGLMVVMPVFYNSYIKGGILTQSPRTIAYALPACLFAVLALLPKLAVKKSVSSVNPSSD
jgi:hypothetical protein